ncbi:hypothetical protein QYF61_011371 [Mycteria americana]|uniref:ribonuclease H n=1 Tax=Mycteria americana TaxID=33587 RepID=A0AAN7NXU8_MYCAM|nr:hypothetical protein QYF61_011371 [Mycteria americana]
MQKDFSCRPGKHVVTWLLRCWDNGASSLELEGKEAKQLESLSKEGSIDKAVGKGALVLSLWKYEGKISLRGRYLPGKWTTMERGIQYLRELAVLEVIYGDLDNEQLPKDPDEVQCTRPMWQKLVWSAPASYANSLAVTIWKDRGGQSVDEVDSQLRTYEASFSSYLVLAVEKLPGRSSNSKRRGPASTHVEERDIRVYWTVWIRWPSTSDPQDYKALVHTGAQCTLMPSSYIEAEPTCISGVTGRSQQLTVLEAEVSLTGNEWQKHPIVTGPEAPCILGIDYLRRGYFKDQKGYWWAFDIAALEAEEVKQLSTLPGLSEDPSVMGLLRVEEQQSNGEWRLTADYHSLNEVTPPLSAAVPDMLVLQYELESKAAKPQFAFTWRGVQYTWNRLPQGWKHSATICHGLIQAALEQGEAPEHLQYTDDIIVWGNTAAEVFEKGKKIVQLLLKASFAMKQSKVKGPAQEIQFLGIKWQDGCHQIPMDVINKITHMSPPTSKKETQAFLGISLIVSPLYQVTGKKNNFKWGPEQRQAFEQIKREIVHAVALGPVRAGQDVKNVLYTAAGENGPTWSLWQKAPGETRGRPLGFWSQGYRGSKACYIPTEKERLAAYEGVRAAAEVVARPGILTAGAGLDVQSRVPSTRHVTDAMWIIIDWPEGKDFRILPEEEVARAEEAPLYNKLPENEKHYALFTDGSRRIVQKHRRWKAAGWRLNHFPGQPVPTLDNPFSELKFPNIQSKPPLVQLEAISSPPITCYLGEETDPHLSTTSFQPLFPKPVALHGVVVAYVQDLALSLLEPHTIDPSPSIQPVQVPLYSLPTLKQINTPAQLGVICNLTEGALDPSIQIIDKDIKQDWPQHRALGDTSCDWPPTGVNSIHHHSLGLAIQPVLYPAKSTPIHP